MLSLEIVALVGALSLVVGLNTMSKVAMEEGMNNFVYNSYSTSLGVLFLLPFTIIFHRVTSPPPQLTLSIFCKLCLLGFMRYCTDMFSYIGIGFSSPTMASALVNLTPAFAFILAKITGMEKLNFKSKSTQAKSIGTITSILGALIVTFYHGPSLVLVFTSPTSMSLHKDFHVPSQHNWVIGGFFLASSSLLLAVLFTVQAWIIKEYPAELMITLVSSTFESILSTTISFIIVRDPNAWKLRADIELATILYAAIFTVSLRNTIYAWLLRKKGPLFVTMGKPLEMIIAPAMGIIFLGDTLHLGSVIGAFIIAIGFYTVLWGKANEEKVIEEPHGVNSPSDKLPLLQKESIHGYRF